MCGIHCILYDARWEPGMLDEEARTALGHRGPDGIGTWEGKCGEAGVRLTASVLGTRGPPTAQPLSAFRGEAPFGFAFNGTLWDGLPLPPSHNDTQIFSRALLATSSAGDLVDLVRGLEGPFAFFLAHDGWLWFARDAFGRRSLLLAQTPSAFHLSSMAARSEDIDKEDEWMEVPSGVLFRFRFQAERWDMEYAWIRRGLEPGPLQQLIQTLPQLRPMHTNGQAPSLTPHCQSPALLHLRSRPSPELPMPELIEAWCSYLAPELATFHRLFDEAVKRRTETVLHCEASGRTPDADGDRDGDGAPVAILFSGGVDSLAIAAAAHRSLIQLGRPSDPIDLLNVAFQLPDGSFKVPDRELGLASLRALQRLYPERDWRFVGVDVSGEELVSARQQHIRRLLLPATSVLDDSIGCALWFAARAQGTRLDTPAPQPYTSRARIVLVGSGADEVLGGYARHRTRWEKGGWEGLGKELELELGRLGRRNLGRDDRVLSDSGRESRLPFLDHRLLAFLSALPLSNRCDFRLPRFER